MKIVIQVLMICLFLGIIAGRLQLFLWRGKETSGNRLPVMAFYTIIFYGILSVVKMILGDKDLTLFQSFREMSTDTYYHYLPPLLIMSIVFPIGVNMIFKKCEVHLLSVYNSWIVMLFAGIFAITGSVNNRMYICILAGALLLTLVTYRSIHIEIDRRVNAKYIVPTIVFWVTTVIIYIPGEIYVHNAWEFPASPLN
ncbi:MAG: hypothetical protein K2P63_08200, partial [Lachnospiraceae bacterium]|nr:hypothetical protein [Lachnospiraceae bacterium]